MQTKKVKSCSFQCNCVCNLRQIRTLLCKQMWTNSREEVSGTLGLNGGSYGLDFRPLAPQMSNSAVRWVLPSSRLPRAGRYDQHKVSGYTMALMYGRSLDPQAQEHANRMPTHPSKAMHRPELEPQGPAIGDSSPTRGMKQANTKPRNSN